MYGDGSWLVVLLFVKVRLIDERLSEGGESSIFFPIYKSAVMIFLASTSFYVNVELSHRIPYGRTVCSR